MKGTRPRGRSLEEDSSLRQELMHSTKEIAELLMVMILNVMIWGRCAILVRSGWSREMRTIEEYKTVFQATSTIEGRLRKDKTCFDLIEACFPGGSVTGCPKISAMRIIDELEPGSRGIYTGAFGYIDFSAIWTLISLSVPCFLTKEKFPFMSAAELSPIPFLRWNMMKLG